MAALRDRNRDGAYIKTSDGDIKIKNANDVSPFILNKFKEVHSVDQTDGGEQALKNLKNVVKYFMNKDADGYFSLNSAFAFALDQPCLIKSFLKTGLAQMEPVSYAYGQIGEVSYLGVYVPPMFYMASERPYDMVVVDGIENIIPIAQSVWEKEKGRIDPDMCAVIEDFYNSSVQENLKPRVIFDMNGTLVRWDNDWSMGPYGVSAWKRPGFFEHCVPHKAMVSLCTALLENPNYNVFATTSTNHVKHVVDETLRWTQRYIPNMDPAHILFIEDGKQKGAAIRPNARTVIFDDYHLAIQNYLDANTDKKEPVIIQVLNNLTIPSDPIVSEITCSADMGLSPEEFDKIVSSNIKLGGSHGRTL